MPVGSPVEGSASIRTPSHGGRVARVIPARRSASVFAIDTSGAVWRQ